MTSVPCQEPPNRSGSLERRNSGCGWLRIRVFLARICRDLPMQVFDLLDYHEGHMKFETRHSPHIIPGRPIFTVVTLIC